MWTIGDLGETVLRCERQIAFFKAKKTIMKKILEQARID